MSDNHWLNQVSANFNTAADWSLGTVPGANDNVFLDAAGSTPYTVTSSIQRTVFSLQLANTATLAITGFASFTVTSPQFQNAGAITIGSGATFSTANAQFVNSGTIALQSVGGLTTLAFASGGTLTGGGTISLSDNEANTITLFHTSLTNADNTIVGSGTLVDRGGRLINEAGGVIDADNKTRLFINARFLSNAGLMETTGKGHLTIVGALNNTGTLEANGGVMNFRRTVGSSGSVVISAGTIDFQASFSGNVSFTGTKGQLDLAASQSYTGNVTGFSKTGRTSLDLGDIGFVSSTEATFSGTATSGVLTVTDGSHTAHITLIGDYTASTFVASGDGEGGTVVATSASPTSEPAHPFIAAAAGLGGSAGEAIHTGAAWAAHAPMLAKPRAMIA